MVTVSCAVDVVVPSLIVYVIVSMPLHPPAGVYSTFVFTPLPVMTAVPCASPVTPVTVRGSLFASVSFASTLTVTGVRYGVVAVSSAAAGATFGIVTLTVPIAVPPSPSLTV